LKKIPLFRTKSEILDIFTADTLQAGTLWFGQIRFERINFKKFLKNLDELFKNMLRPEQNAIGEGGYDDRLQNPGDALFD